MAAAVVAAVAAPPLPPPVAAARDGAAGGAADGQARGSSTDGSGSPAVPVGGEAGAEAGADAGRLLPLSAAFEVVLSAEEQEEARAALCTMHHAPCAICHGGREGAGRWGRLRSTPAAPLRFLRAPRGRWAWKPLRRTSEAS